MMPDPRLPLTWKDRLSCAGMALVYTAFAISFGILLGTAINSLMDFFFPVM